MADVFAHVFIIGSLVLAVHFMFSPEQAAVSIVVGIIGGLYFQSVTALYIIFFVTIPEFLVAAFIGGFIGIWLVDDS